METQEPGWGERQRGCDATRQTTSMCCQTRPTPLWLWPARPPVEQDPIAWPLSPPAHTRKRSSGTKQADGDTRPRQCPSVSIAAVAPQPRRAMLLPTSAIEPAHPTQRTTSVPLTPLNVRFTSAGTRSAGPRVRLTASKNADVAASVAHMPAPTDSFWAVRLHTKGERVKAHGATRRTTAGKQAGGRPPSQTTDPE